MLLVALLACQPDDAGPPAAPELVVDVRTDPVFEVVPDGDGTRFGEQIVAGSDLDHDGVWEWATVSIPWDATAREIVGAPSVAVHEGEERIATLTADGGPDVWYGWAQSLATGADADGDGHADLVVASLWGVEPPELRLHTDTGSGTALPSLQLDEVWRAEPKVAMARTAAGVEVVMAMEYGFGSARVDRFPDGRPDPEPWMGSSDTHGNGTWSTPLPVDLDTDGFDDHLLFGHSDMHLVEFDVDEVGQAQLCPLDVAQPSEADCTWLAGGPERPELGAVYAAGDLDGDGIAELVTTTTSPSHGVVLVFDADGTARARIRNASWSDAHTLAVVQDDAGEAWLIMATDDAGSETLYGFRGPRLDGDLDVLDADRRWELPITFDIAVAPYRATADAPLQLLVGAADHVYLLPFEP